MLPPDVGQIVCDVTSHLSDSSNIMFDESDKCDEIESFDYQTSANLAEC